MLDESLFVKDKEIFTDKSPYAAYKNEEKIYTGNVNIVSVQIQMLQINRNGEAIDYKIMECLNELEFACSRQVALYLNLKGESVSQEKVYRRLKFLSKYNIITSYGFKSDDGMPSFTIYCLQHTAKQLLMARNIYVKWKNGDNERDIVTTKEILARNHLLLTHMKSINNLEKYLIKEKILLNKLNKTYYIPLIIKLDTEDNLMFEFIRNYTGSKEKLEERIKSIDSFLNEFITTEKISSKPQLVIVCENDRHIYEIYSHLLKKEIKINDGYDYIFTTDVRLVTNEIQKCFIKCIIENNDEAKLKTLIYKKYKPIELT